MSDAKAATEYLVGEVESLEPFEYIVVAPAGRPLHVCEVGRREDGTLEVRVPGRPAIVPPLDTEIRAALVEREFSSDDPADSTRPWVRAVSDAPSAIERLKALHVEVFGEKIDAKLDIAHGSHKSQHEAQQKLAHARSRIEKIVGEMLGKPAEQDEDLDYILPIQQVHVMVAPRATLDGQIVVRVFVITNVGVQAGPELGLFLARLNFGLMFGRFALDVDHRSIWFDETLLGEEFREEELRFAIDMIASTADAWDDRLKQMFGGLTHQEIMTNRSNQDPPLTKPGEGVGQYL